MGIQKKKRRRPIVIYKQGIITNPDKSLIQNKKNNMRNHISTYNKHTK